MATGPHISDEPFPDALFCVSKNFCVVRRVVSLVPRAYDDSVDPGTLQELPACKDDTAGLETRCAEWASVGDCTLSRQYMWENCQTACAREGNAHCRLE